MLYRYTKAPVKYYQPPGIKKPSHAKKLIPSILITVGSILLANAAWPIISYQVLTSPNIKRTPIISPLQENSFIQVIPNSNNKSTSQAPQALGQTVDYTDVKNWFPNKAYPQSLTYDIQEYTINIPSVDIKDARVIIGGEFLEKGLIHFPGTSLPGQLGAPVIFGHSILRQFYAPQVSNPNRYISIFSKIMTLKEGDEITIDYDGIRYVYHVKEKAEVKPEDVFILQQRLNSRELKLITCVPEGTYLRRGVIVAELVDLN